MKKLNRGILISVEGIDGSGKSTFAKKLYELLLGAGYPVLTREPGGTEFGKKIREVVNYSPIKIDYLTEFLLFAADRSEHISKIVKPALEKKIVISDRMADSSVAYQGCGRGIDLDLIKVVNTHAMSGISPDLVIYTWVDIKTALERIYERKEKKTIFEKETKKFFETVAGCFENMYSDRGEVVKLDGTESPEVIAKNGFNTVTRFAKDFLS